MEDIREYLDEGRETRKQGFLEPVLASGEVERTHLDFGW
jgi:hypothetical protein